MKKREFIISGIVVLTMGIAAGCGSKVNSGTDAPSTYNIVKSVNTQTMNPTIIVPETKVPAEKKEETTTPAPSNTPNTQKQKVRKTKSPAKTSTPAPVATKQPEKKQVTQRKAITSPTKKPEVKKTATPAPAMTEEPVKTTVTHVKSMKSIFTTIALYMSEGQTYDPGDEECYYSIMYMLANNVAYKCGKSQYEETEDGIYVGRGAMEALSAAAFAEHDIIGTIPKDYEDMIRYDKDKQRYILYGSDSGDVTGRIIESTAHGNGTYTVYFNLLTGDGKEVLSSYQFTLLENEGKYAKISPNFYYRVQSVKKLTE